MDEEPRAQVRLHLREESLLVEVGQELDVLIDRELVVKAARSRGGVGEPGTTEFVRGPLDGWHVARPTIARPIVAITRPDPCLIEDVIEDLVRAEPPGIVEP